MQTFADISLTAEVAYLRARGLHELTVRLALALTRKPVAVGVVVVAVVL